MEWQTIRTHINCNLLLLKKFFQSPSLIIDQNHA